MVNAAPMLRRQSVAGSVSRQAAAIPLEQAIWAALEDVHDPEIPAVSVVDLGIVHRVRVAPGMVRVELLPTFVGCPAIDVMREAVVERLRPFAPTVEAEITFAEPWTTERITPQGRRRLRESGFAPPSVGLADDDDGESSFLPVLSVATCPYCGSRATRLENAFGPTLCRSIQYCDSCQQPFEAFKPV